MSVSRRFLVAPSLVRLIRKERGGSRIIEGYFAPQGGRTSFVRVDGQDCHLVLISKDADGNVKEERTEVPRGHGDALLDVCPGKATYERTTLSLDGRHEVAIDRFSTPHGLDLASVAFDDEAAAEAFSPPTWFGKDVSKDPSYERHAIAIQGIPAADPAGLTDAALDAVLDLLEPRFGFNAGGGLRRPLNPAPAPAAKAPEAVKAAAIPAEAAKSGPAAVAPPQAAAKPAAAGPAPGPAASAPAAVKPAPAASTAPPTPPSEPSAPKAAVAAAPSAPPSKPDAIDAAGAERPAEAGSTPPKEGAGDGTPAAAEKAQDKGDARIDDVIESLSQALSAAIQQPREPARDEDLDASFERWTVRPRRTNQS